MGHEHNHTNVTSRRLTLSIIVTVAFVVGEAIAGYFAHSLSLLADAGHNFSDALALALSWYAVWIARKPPDAQRTFGYHRVGILAALINSVSLVIIALLIFWEAFDRLREPQAVHSLPMIVVALIAIAMNTLISLGLRGGSKHDLNIRSAYLHMLGDAISSAGVVTAGIVVAISGVSIADPIVSILIGLLILLSSWSILKDSVNVLLEATPGELDMAKLEQAITQVTGVLTVHDLHVWTVGSGIIACSCHIMVAEQSVRSGEQVLRRVVEGLKKNFKISHTTIQVEVEGCEPNDIYCEMKIKAAEHTPDHHH